MVGPFRFFTGKWPEPTNAVQNSTVPDYPLAHDPLATAWVDSSRFRGPRTRKVPGATLPIQHIEARIRGPQHSGPRASQPPAVPSAIENNPRSRGWTRTTDLQVMSLARCSCATSAKLINHNLTSYVGMDNISSSLILRISCTTPWLFRTRFLTLFTTSGAALRNTRGNDRIESVDNRAAY